MRDQHVAQLEAELAQAYKQCRSLVDEAVATMTSRMDAGEHDLRVRYEAQLETAREMNAALQAEVDRLQSNAMPPAAFDQSWQKVGSQSQEFPDSHARGSESLEDYMRSSVSDALKEGIGLQESHPIKPDAKAPVAGLTKPTLPLEGGGVMSLTDPTSVLSQDHLRAREGRCNSAAHEDADEAGRGQELGFQS